MSNFLRFQVFFFLKNKIIKRFFCYAIIYSQSQIQILNIHDNRKSFWFSFFFLKTYIYYHIINHKVCWHLKKKNWIFIIMRANCVAKGTFILFLFQSSNTIILFLENIFFNAIYIYVCDIIIALVEHMKEKSYRKLLHNNIFYVIVVPRDATIHTCSHISQ